MGDAMKTIGLWWDQTIRRLTRTRHGLTAENRLLFLHIPKTAGCSINQFLINRFPAGQTCLIHPRVGDDVAGLIPETPLLCYSGHVTYDFTRLLPGNLRVFTLLRDPVERSLSSYFFYRRSRPEDIAESMLPVQHMEMGAFVRTYPKEAEIAFGNRQVMYFSRPYDYFRQPFANEDHPVTREELGLAKENLSRCLVGLVERIGDALTLLSHDFGWPVPDRVAEENRTVNRPKSVDSAGQAWLMEHTSLDQELYAHGQQLFLKRWEKLQKHHEDAGASRLGPVGRISLRFDQAIPGYGWSGRDQSHGKVFCWMEPEAWLEFPPLKGSAAQVEVDALDLLPGHFDFGIQLRVNGVPIALERRTIPGGKCYHGVVKSLAPADKTRVEIRASQPVRPCDLDPRSMDKRPLSLAVTEVRLRSR